MNYSREIIILITIVTALTDYFVPNIAAIGAVYSIPVYIGSSLLKKANGRKLTILYTIIIFATFYLNFSEDRLLSDSVNRIISILSLWLAYYLSYKIPKSNKLNSLSMKSKDLVVDTTAAITKSDVNGIITYVNEKFCQISQFSSKELIGTQHRLACFDKNSNLSWEKYLKAHEDGNEYNGEIINKAKDGSDFWLQTKMLRKLGKSGNIESYIEISTDITKEKKLGFMLEKQVRQALAISENALNAIIVCNDNKEIIFWNKEAENIFTWKENEALGKQVDFLIPERFKKRHHQGFSKINKDRPANVRQVELVGIRKNGREFPLEISLSSWIEQEKLFIVAYIVDITIKKKQENLLSHQAKLASIGEMAAGVGHEINNPLSIIIGSGNLLAKSVSKDCQDCERGELLLGYCNKVANAGDRIKNIVDGLRTYSRSVSVDMEIISVTMAIKQTKGLVTEVYETEGIALSYKSSDKDLYTIGNFGKLQQVIMNLISNAKDASEGMNTRKIDLSLQRYGDDQLILSVTDNGCGISEKIKEKILHPFFTTKEVGKGTGMGLSYVSEITKEMNGELRISSVLEQGSTFSIILPLKNKDKNQHQIKKQNKHYFSGNILVVEDEDDIREILVEIYSSFGLIVDEAEDGDTALEMVKKNQYDYISTDMKMKRLQGIEFIKEYRKLPNSNAKVFVVSGGVSIDYEKVLGNIIDGSIIKPFTEESLHKMLSSFKNVHNT